MAQFRLIPFSLLQGASLEAGIRNNRKNASKKNNYCHILSHFYWNEKLQKETFGGRTTARRVFPLAMVRTSKRKLFQTQFISMSKHAIEGRIGHSVDQGATACLQGFDTYPNQSLSVTPVEPRGQARHISWRESPWHHLVSPIRLANSGT